MRKSKRARRTRDEVKHEAIMKVATRLFLKHGYANTSMDAIADAARVTKQTVYSHYKNKDALFTHMIATLCEKHTPPEALRENPGQSVESLLYGIGVGFLNMITSYEGLAATRLVIAEVQTHPKLAKRFYEGGTQRMIAMLSQLLARLNNRGILSIPDTASAASYFFAMLKGRYHLRMLLAIKPLPTVKERQAHVRETVRIFMKLYGGANALHTRSVS